MNDLGDWIIGIVCNIGTAVVFLQIIVDSL